MQIIFSGALGSLSSLLSSENRVSSKPVVGREVGVPHFITGHDGCFGFNGPLRQYFSLYRAVSQREGERGEKG